ncbi:MAG: ABC transporter permease [Armatimonadetes bacterium]|nr:ABC transporter permease [Armatimonadota bacterium]MBS1711720.1 ABC transporter permease [Armatimonadota bacterium]MBX3109726.1 ABC transporter permease [Fimbriimonadaceae bacterium]
MNKFKGLSPLFWLGVTYLVFLVVLAVFGPTFRHQYDVSSAPPFLKPNSTYWLGTDEIGRDIFARLAYGARTSLTIGIVVQAIAVAVGIVVGIVSVYAPKWISIPVQRFTDGMFAFPDLLLAIMIVGVFQMGVGPVIIGLAFTAWPPMARLVKNQVATLKDREYVVAAKAMGANTPYLVVKHILPHLWGIIFAVMMVDVAATILAESTLSFLGIGIQPPEPSWGQMIQVGNTNKNSEPLMLLWPCIALSLTIFALNFVGDGLRTIVDPKKNQAI